VKVVKPYVRVGSPSLSVIMIMGHFLVCALACHTCSQSRLPTPIDRRSGCTLSRDIDNRKRIVRLDSPRCILGCLNNGIILSPEYPASLVIANATEVSTNRKQVIPRYFSVRCGIGKKRGDSVTSVSSRGCLQRGCQAFPIICTDDKRSVFFSANKYLVHGYFPPMLKFVPNDRTIRPSTIPASLLRLPCSIETILFTSWPVHVSLIWRRYAACSSLPSVNFASDCAWITICPVLSRFAIVATLPFVCASDRCIPI